MDHAYEQGLPARRIAVDELFAPEAGLAPRGGTRGGSRLMRREWQHPTMGSGPFFSRALEAPKGRHVYFAGQAPNDAAGATVPGGIDAQADTCFGKLQALVEAAGATMADFVMLNVYATDLAQFGQVQDVYRR